MIEGAFEHRTDLKNPTHMLLILCRQILEDPLLVAHGVRRRQ